MEWWNAEMKYDPDEVQRTGRGKKDRKKWCKGKVGVPHIPVVTEPNYWSLECGWFQWYVMGIPEKHKDWNCLHTLNCETCGKILKQWINPQDCPSFTQEINNAKQD